MSKDLSVWTANTEGTPFVKMLSGQKQENILAQSSDKVKNEMKPYWVQNDSQNSFAQVHKIPMGISIFGFQSA